MPSQPTSKPSSQPPAQPSRGSTRDQLLKQRQQLSPARKSFKEEGFTPVTKKER